MINVNRIIRKIVKYVVALMVTMLGWNLAGSAVTAKDDFAVVAGFGLYLLLVIGWVWLLGNEVNGILKKQSTDKTNNTDN
jgi:hypothetical protein